MIKAKSKLETALNSQLGISLLLGLISFVMGELRFEIPEIVGSSSDLREIPLLISIFYIQNPIYFLVCSALTSLGTMHSGSIVTTFVMHSFALVASGYLYRKYLSKINSSIEIGIKWGLIACAFYLLFLLPAMMITDHIMEINIIKDPWSEYLRLVKGVSFELVTTGLVTGLYLIQLRIRNRLLEHQMELEDQVDKRTSQLALANYNLMSVNKELLNSNNEINELNENLDELVQERTEKIRLQLDQLIKFAHMNSHGVRAPLSRILGLIPVIRAEKDSESLREMMVALEKSSNELDEIIKSMNIMLESEVLLSTSKN